MLCSTPIEVETAEEGASCTKVFYGEKNLSKLCLRDLWFKHTGGRVGYYTSLWTHIMLSPVKTRLFQAFLQVSAESAKS